MKSKFASFLFLYFPLFVFGCQTNQQSSNQSDRNTATALAKIVEQKVVEYADKPDFKSAFQYYPDDSDVWYVENRQMYPLLQSGNDNYDQIAPIIQSVHNIVDNRNGVAALDDNAVLPALPLHFTIQSKRRPEYKGQYVRSRVEQKRLKRWMII